MTGIPTSEVSAYAAPPAALKPHRGTVVLVLGILGLAVCAICGIIAWVMGHNDLKEMDLGLMDPTGRGTTQAGKICGMISCILAMVALVGPLLFFLVIFFLGIFAGLAGAG